MKCVTGCGKGAGNAGGSGQTVQNISFQEISQPQVEAAPEGFFYPDAFTKEQANNKLLKMGTYQIEGIINNPNNVVQTFRNVEMFVPVGQEQKKVLVKRFSVKQPDTIDGEKVSRYTATVEVIENPIPIAAVVYGLSAIGSLTAGWFFVDKVQRFTSTGIGGLLAGLAAAVAVYQFVLK